MALTKIPASLLDTSSGINGLIYPTSDGTSGQFLKTDGSGNLTFATVTTYTDSDVETYLDGGSSTPTFASATVSGTLTVTGNLDITGDINSYNVTDLDVTDQTITLGAGQTEANSGGSGIIIDGSSASILWDETNDEWDFNKNINVTGTVNSMTIAASGFTCPTSQNFIINSPNALRINIDSNNDGTAEAFTVGHNQDTAANTNVLFNITESGKASIGHSAANANLHIGSAAATGDATNPALQIGGASTYRLGMYTSTEGAVIANANGDDGIQFVVKTAGEAMRIDGGTGNVGIGEVSPSTSLHVSKGTSGSGLIDVARFENQGTNVNDGARIQLTAGASTSGAGIGCLGDALNSAHLVFHAGGNTERMRITSDGEVRVNAVARQTMAEFNNRQNGAVIEFGHENNGGQYYGTLGVFGTNGHPYIGFSTDSESSADTFTTRGVAGNIITGDIGNGSLKFMQVTSSSATGQTPVERMRIASDGKLLINNTANVENGIVQVYGTKSLVAGIPQGLLQVSDKTSMAAGVGGGINFTGAYLSNGTHTSFASIEGNKANGTSGNYGGDLVFKTRVHGGSQSERMRIDSVGEVSIKRAGSGGTGILKALNLNHAGTSVNDGAKISFTAGTSTEGAGIASTGQALNSADLRFYTGGTTERMRIDSSGHVIVGSHNSTTEAGKFNVYTDATNDSAIYGYRSTSYFRIVPFLSNGAHSGLSNVNDSGLFFSDNFVIAKNVGGYLGAVFRGDGSIFIGTESEATGSTGGATFSADSSNRRNLILATTGTGSLELIEFRNPNGTVGTIKTSGTSTSYNTSSDYRLKENIDYDFTALDRVTQLKPARFNFITDEDTILDGFLAHEVSSIVPEAVSGEKDATKEEEYEITPAQYEDDGETLISEAVMGTRTVPVYQGIDQSKLVPLLTKAIQEQQTIIDDLKSRIETLEG